MLLSTPHAHTTYVDGKSTPREMVEVALAKGFVSLGFSEHAVQPRDPEYCLSPEGETAYIAEVRALQREYAGRIRIWLGAERDWISTAQREKFDYVIGSVHYVPAGDEYALVDGPVNDLRKRLCESFRGDSMAYIAAYYDLLAGYIASYRPQIIGHLDLVRKWRDRLHLYDSEDSAYRRLVIGALERMADSGALLEVNTGAMARGYLSAPYPERFALDAWRALGGRVIISSDCHLAEKLDCGYDAARALLLDAGYDRAMALGTGDILFVETEL